ncbi:hypothetical protein HUG15_06170 [Salicibibacter cibarius]|uniref:Uncharacterized protein n=1 Tax=Salicibibacter cibarius TaxID=2743000 RepID=A0A7T7CAV0_9BACI|nr:hypothetical protein [Salicibibacter cibarius]QQK75228.1 hypothetical protein HUG15_06170 [Salicibibacter cibarius]
MSIMIAVTLAIAVVIAIIEVPYLVKNTFIKEICLFAILLCIAIVLSIVHE